MWNLDTQKLTKLEMIAPLTSCCVNIPVNMVQYPFESGLDVSRFYLDENLLNRWFLSGKRIDLDETFQNVIVRGSHQEIELKFFN